MAKLLKRIVMFLIIAIILLTVKSNAFTTQMSTDKNEIRVGDEVIYTINSDENVVAANFDINYNSSSLELIGSSTNGLDVESKNGKIACIYADINGIGTKNFQIRFRAKDTNTSVNFGISDAKFRGVNQEESYENEDVIGLTTQTNIRILSNNVNNNLNNSVDNTVIQTRLPQTGVSNIFLILIIALSIIIAIIFKFKLKKIKNILPMIIGIVMIGGLTYNIQAVTNNVTVNISNNIAQIVLSNNRSITKNELIQANENITSIKNENQVEIGNSELVKTGFILETSEGTANITLLGDANKDGYICDTDDLMIIINSHLGKKTPDEISKVAANLDNKNDVLDEKDIVEMKNIFLGRQSGNVTNNNPVTPNTPIEPETPVIPNNPSSNSKTLVVYYSAQSHTKAVAEKLANNLNADIFEIVPEQIYTADDLDWTNSNSRVSREHNDESLRNVRLRETQVANWENYDTVLIGYPIWWGIAAWPVNTFVKVNDFTGKKVIPFCTSSSSGLGQSGELLEQEANAGTWQEGHRFSSNPSDADIKNWTDSLK